MGGTESRHLSRTRGRRMKASGCGIHVTADLSARTAQPSWSVHPGATMPLPLRFASDAGGLGNRHNLFLCYLGELLARSWLWQRHRLGNRRDRPLAGLFEVSRPAKKRQRHHRCHHQYEVDKPHQPMPPGLTSAPYHGSNRRDLAFCKYGILGNRAVGSSGRSRRARGGGIRPKS